MFSCLPTLVDSTCLPAMPAVHANRPDTRSAWAAAAGGAWGAEYVGPVPIPDIRTFHMGRYQHAKDMYVVECLRISNTCVAFP